MNKKYLAAILMGLFMFGMAGMASATTMVTKSGDENTLQAILDFDAGSLGIVDIDFGGNNFNLAFGTDPVPAGFLFTSTKADALTLITNIQTELNLFNASATTDINQVENAIQGTLVPFAPYINVAYGVTPTTNGVWQIDSGWNAPYRGMEFSRTQENFVYARMTSAAPIPEPTTMLLLGTGLVGVAGAARRRKKTQA